jgi:hypothetical protein
MTFARACLFGLIATFTATVGHAQARRQVKRPPGELMAALAHDNAAPGRTSSAGMDLMSVLLGQADYPSGHLAALLDGLEGVALTEPSPNVRAEATLSLSMAGSRSARQPQPSNVARLERIYARSDDAQVRAAVVAGLARSVDHPRALAFLEKVATRDPADYPGAPLDALASIASHDEAGSAVLKRLHTTRAIREADARTWLDLVAEQGYRVQ